MKLNFLLIVTITYLFLLLSCTKQRIGQWDDIIQLSGKVFTLNSNEDSLLVTAKGKWWQISYVALDTNQININTSNADVCNFVYNDNNIKIISKDCNSLLIKMNQNITNLNRVLKKGLWAGDYSDGIKIVQKGR